MKKTPLKRGNSQLKKVPLKKTSSMGIKRKTPDPKYLADRKQQRTNDIEFYEKIWSKRKHICEICSAPLYNEISTAFFDHLIEKAIHPELRYEENNIILVCIDCHSLKTNGFMGAEYADRILKAKKEFNI
jgi:hypothetical protein